jgi:mono/diheme cytochrome c family protein
MLVKFCPGAALLAAVAFAALPQEARLKSQGSESIPPPAWQSGDEALAARWKQITGRYIFQQACASCHNWGPNYWSRNRWRDYLRDFPGNHQPEVQERYKDLTAMFEAGKMVPNSAEERDALATFLLASAPPQELPKEQRDQKFRGAPEVGETAPGFSIADINGRSFSLRELRNKRPLVLVFSRAHW